MDINKFLNLLEKGEVCDSDLEDSKMVNDVILEIQKKILFKSNFNYVIYWSNIIAKLKNKQMMDEFFSFYLNMKDNSVFIGEIKRLYVVFDDYYLKYARELKTIDEFKDLNIILSEKFEKKVEKLKSL